MILSAGVGFYMAWWAYGQGRSRLAVACLALAGFVMRLYAGADTFLHLYDERYHALVARNLMAHPLVPTLYDDPVLPYDPTNWTANHVWLHKPPLALWLMALSMATLGVNEIAARLPSLVLSTTAIFLTYCIGTRLFDDEVALFAAYLHAVNPALTQLASGRGPVDHVDSLFVFLVELGVFVAVLYRIRPANVLLPLIGAVTGAALLTKWLAGLLVIPIWLALAWDRERLVSLAWKTLLIVSVVTLVVAPWQLYIHYRFPVEAAHEMRYSFEHLFEVKEGHGGSVWLHVATMPRVFGELVFLPVAWFLWRFRRARGGHSAGTLAIWLIVPYVVFSLAATKMRAYVLIAAPAVFLIGGLFVSWLSRLRVPPARLVWKMALLAAMVILPLRQGIERLEPLNRDDVRNQAWARELRDLAPKVSGTNAVLFIVGGYADGVERHVEAMFFTGRPAYPRAPRLEEIDRLARSGRKVVVYRRAGAELPPYLRGDSRVVVLSPPAGGGS